ncbi:hypothetical protein MKW98_003734 [Papaver atlanticum]|uniref:AB hydrolase-1 domain-containing protein n=1 Tax=Papaver atlanticum TaxID=357466 RepID=A0AAD4XS55_9MAGN|nr:hypothetical protein MKW98_003734 [Papaver atlanticum]
MTLKMFVILFKSLHLKIPFQVTFLHARRYLAYKESGVPKSEAPFKIIVIHGFNDAEDFYLPASEEVVEELGVYLLTFDRAGYGESDPNPKRSVKSEAFDIQELADQLELGSKFYIVGVSLGGYPVWGCLKYIPNRIAGASLVAPIINYWWLSFPSNVSKMAYKKLLLQDQWIYRVAHYAPQLLYSGGLLKNGFPRCLQWRKAVGRIQLFLAPQTE